MIQDLLDYHKNILQQKYVLSVLLLDKSDEYNFILEDADFIFLIVLHQAEEKLETRYVMCGDQKIVEHRIHQWYLEQLSKQGMCNRLYWMLLQGEIVYDHHDYMKNNRERLTRITSQMQKKRICEDYSSFLQSYLWAKEFLQQNHTMDAYHAVLHALNGWARLVVSETGEQHEPLLWNQVRQLEPTVYKLYEELIAGSEPLEKRMELLLLPIEFSIMSKMKESTLFIIDIMKTQNKPWTFEELKQHPEILNSQINLAVLLDKMLKRSFIQSVPIHQKEKPFVEQGFFAFE